MASIALRGTGDPWEISQILKNGLENSAISCEMVDSVQRDINGGFLCVMVFEKYYMRASNRASLTVIVTSPGNNEVTVNAISSGGGQGAIFKFSWGAEENFAATVGQILSSRGFR